MPQSPTRRALPTLFVSEDEHAILEKAAKDDGLTVVELLKMFISDCVEGEDNVRVVVVPHKTWSAFAAVFDDEPVERAMARYLESEGEVLGRALAEAKGK
jgi:hypothetical protein